MNKTHRETGNPPDFLPTGGHPDMGPARGAGLPPKQNLPQPDRDQHPSREGRGPKTTRSGTPRKPRKAVPSTNRLRTARPKKITRKKPTRKVRNG